MAILKTFSTPVLAAAVLGIAMMFNPLSAAYAQSKINCTCRFAGANYGVGELACIRGKLSRCSFVLNNTSWKTVADTCPQASNSGFPGASGFQQSPVTDNEITILARMHARFAIK